MGFLGENSEVSKGLGLFEEFKISIFGFVEVNLVYSSSCTRQRGIIGHKGSLLVWSCKM